MNTSFDPAEQIQNLLQFGEFGGVNPSITDSSTFTFLDPVTMTETFLGHTEGCFLYSRHWNPSNKYLADALAAMEGTENAWITASGMAAITCAILQLCNSGDHLITSVTTYGGTFAFLSNYLPKFNISVSFVDITDIDSIKQAIRPNTKLIYTETVTNPLLQISDIPVLSDIAREHGITLMVDNTFIPMAVSPARLGADIVVYSLTKFINGKNDCIAGAICGTNDFIDALSNVKNGTAMLLGPVLDPLRSSGILKNLHTLHIRMKQHSHNAMTMAKGLQKLGVKVIYPGLPSHPQHELFCTMVNPGYGYGGMMAIDVETVEKANELMGMMQAEGVGYLAVSLGYFKTLFSNSGRSTSSEVPKEVQQKMGLSEGLVRFSIGLDNNIDKSLMKVRYCLTNLRII
ncbi:MAG: aminotransferase class I/II-fold pyridoxal phosphate-dependent enzyme [Bacteroidales bacterium]|nr:aminotransferase class I/II-fold pyridoxal phosphate-dependent enzyme [Bacteroidales bacterium]MBN2762252.1 aminotransferase class I/II-fold pyridoxal phosphate-dependent enzyme [Bacteroidales bacterium]